MIKKAIIAFLFFTSTSFCTISESPYIGIGLGYRQEGFRFGTFSDVPPHQLRIYEKDKPLHSIESNFSLGVINRDFYISATGTYAHLIDGEGKTLAQTQPLSYVPSTWSYTPCGYDAEVVGLLGYYVNLTPDRFSDLFIVPLAGYGGYWKRIKSPKVNDYNEYIGPGSWIYQSTYLGGKSKQTWYGFALGGKICYRPHHPWRLEGGYFFHWLNLRHSYYFDYQLKRSNALGTLLQDSLITERGKEKRADAYAHVAFFSFLYKFCRYCRYRLETHYHYFSTSKHPHMTRQEKTEQLFPTHTMTHYSFRDRWVSRRWIISGILKLEFSF